MTMKGSYCIQLEGSELILEEDGFTMIGAKRIIASMILSGFLVTVGCAPHEANVAHKPVVSEVETLNPLNGEPEESTLDSSPRLGQYNGS